MNRRKLLKIMTGASLFGTGLVNAAMAETPILKPVTNINPVTMFSPKIIHKEAKTLSLLNLHTDERISLTYSENGEIIKDAVDALNHLLRDHRANETYNMDTGLYDLLHAINEKAQTNIEFNVISGYRSPQTNAKLADASDGVAKGSLHMQGKAIDIRIPGMKLTHVRNLAKEIGVGGVGFYPSSDFVHIDTGRVRYW